MKGLTNSSLRAAKPPLIKFFAKRKKFYQGFTLMEILVAIFIVGIVMATILGTFTGIIASSKNAEKKAELYQTGRVLMDLLASDVRGIFPMRIEGIDPFFSGNRNMVEGRPMSQMAFVSTNVLSIGSNESPFLCEISYYVEKNPKGALYSIWRRAQSPPEYPYTEGGRAVPVCRIVEKFQLDFIYNNDKEEDLQNIIPQAVMINLSLNLDGESENFITMVRPIVVYSKQTIEHKPKGEPVKPPGPSRILGLGEKIFGIK